MRADARRGWRDDTRVLLNGVVLVACLALAALDGYQAVTGRRLSKRPSRRTDEEMRRQSAIAAVLLTLLAVVLLATMLAR
jgi:hypothetical protein